jgi:hypothetical protein
LLLRRRTRPQNRALAATGSEISLAALLLIIPLCTCAPSYPAYLRHITTTLYIHDCVWPLCSASCSFIPLSHAISFLQAPSLECAILQQCCLLWTKPAFRRTTQNTGFLYPGRHPLSFLYPTSPTIEHCPSKHCQHIYIDHQHTF